MNQLLILNLSENILRSQRLLMQQMKAVLVEVVLMVRGARIHGVVKVVPGIGALVVMVWTMDTATTSCLLLITVTRAARARKDPMVICEGWNVNW